MDVVEYKPNKKMVVQANPLLRTGYTLTNLEQRVVRLIITQLDDKRDQDIPMVRITKKQLYEALGLDTTKRGYEMMEEALLTLRSRAIKITFENGTLITGWFNDAVIEKKNEMVTIELSPRLKPYLLNLKESFTKYHLAEVLSFRGEYTIRFFEWFIADQFKKSKSGAWYVSIDVAEIRARLGMVKKGKIIKYPLWANLRTRVIEPSIEEISSISQYWISWEAVKKGRAVHSIKFHIVPKSQPEKQQKKAPAPKLDSGKKPDERLHKILTHLLNKCSSDLQTDFQKKQADLFIELKKSRGRFGDSDDDLLFEIAYGQALDEFAERIQKESL